MRQSDWGGWYLDVFIDDWSLRLNFPHSGHLRYEIELERCCTSAEVLDHVMQVANKRWATDEIVAGLVRALNEVLHPQAKLCSFGNDRHLSVTQVRELARRAASAYYTWAP